MAVLSVSTRTPHVQRSQSDRARRAPGWCPGKVPRPFNCDYLLASLSIGDGSFTAGPWDAVGNCNNSVPVVAPNFLRATVLPHSGPGGTPALQVAASIDAAREATELKWHSGPVLVNIWVRTRSGAPPRMCFWETPIDRCAPTAALPSSSQWRLYRTTVVPATGTENVTLFVYAFAQSPGHVSVDQYAGVVARSILHRPTIDVVGRPTTDAAPTRLLSYPTGYAPGWIGPRDAVHVLVDGLRNGWLTTSNSRAVRKPTYLPSANEGRDELPLAEHHAAGGGRQHGDLSPTLPVGPQRAMTHRNFAAPGAASGSRFTAAVIVPTRNSQGTIVGCLNALRCQTQPSTIIVVDNYSGPDSLGAP